MRPRPVVTVAQRLIERFTGRQRSYGVDERIPEALKRQDETGGVVEGEGDGFGVDEAVDAIDC